MGRHRGRCQGIVLGSRSARRISSSPPLQFKGPALRPRMHGIRMRSLTSARSPWPFALRAVLCALRPRFPAKAGVGPGQRAVARNGRVLLCSDCPLAALTGQVASVRLQTWHRVSLPGDLPAPYGVLLCIRCLDRAPGPEPPLFMTRLVQRSEAAGDLHLDLGGELVLEFRTPPRNTTECRGLAEGDPWSPCV
jgi:hypothetical protein